MTVIEPLELYLEKKYFLNVIKEITVTDSFLTLDENTRGCQEESFDDCTTKKYTNALINKCHCLPFQMRLSQEVGLLSIIQLFQSKELLRFQCALIKIWNAFQASKFQT